MNDSSQPRRSVLAIDVGNSWIKIGEFDWPISESAAQLPLASLPAAPRRVVRLASAEPEWAGLQAWLANDLAAVFLISVCPPASDRLLAWLASTRPDCLLHQLQWTDFPLRVDVEYPDRVGHDRLAAAVAAWQLKAAERAAIVVDAGSAITVDLVSPAGDFCGGAILPGWQSMARVLASTTHNLPQIDTASFPLTAAPPVVGRSTHSAIGSGLFWGSVGAVRELVERMAEPWQPPPERLLAGGDIQAMLPHLGPSFRYVPNLVLQGIVLTAASMTRRSSGKASTAPGEVAGS